MSNKSGSSAAVSSKQKEMATFAPTDRVQETPNSRLESLRRFLYKPTDPASLAVFRMSFGLIMVWECWRYYSKGRIYAHYFRPPFHFSYPYFDWVQPFSQLWQMEGVFLLVAIVSANIAVGFMYRINSIIFFFSFTYIYLCEKCKYLNHLYLVCWVGFLMIFLPANRIWSIDSWCMGSAAPKTVPAWTVYLVQFIVGVPYFFGGIAKLNRDWLIQGEPLRMWLRDGDYGIDFSTWQGWPYFFSWCGMILDLGIVFALLWKPTRNFAFGNALAFHLCNSWLFQIGIFPWFMILATTMYYPPDWPRSFVNFFVRAKNMATSTIDRSTDDSDTSETSAATPLLTNNTSVTPTPPKPHPRHFRTMFWLLLVVSFHILFPLRHYAYPGIVSWTEEGHDFSWHMKLRSKHQGEFRYRVVNLATGDRYVLDPYQWITNKQSRKVGTRPDLILQLAKYMVRVMQNHGLDGAPLEIYADITCSLNGRPFQHLIDPNFNLLDAHNTWSHKKWIIPLYVKYGGKSEEVMELGPEYQPWPPEEGGAQQGEDQPVEGEDQIQVDAEESATDNDEIASDLEQEETTADSDHKDVFSEPDVVEKGADGGTPAAEVEVPMEPVDMLNAEVKEIM